MSAANDAANRHQTYQITEKAHVGLVGLATDQQTVHELLRMKARMYKLRYDGRASHVVALLTVAILQ